MRKYLFLFLIFLFPINAYAYLDPGTGAVLINLIVAGIAAAIYYMKDSFHRLITGGKKVYREPPKISIFSEGKQYWGTFKSLVEGLINEKIPFNYYTLDVKDPALLIENDLMHSKFLGYGSWAYQRAFRINSEFLLATTPNIGTVGYPLKKPANVGNLMHLFHSINDISMYETGSLDAYDSVILVGGFQIGSIREIEELRGLKQKELLPLGLPYLDELIKARSDVPTTKHNKRTVLIGSSWGNKGCLNSYGTGFIKRIADAGYRVIVRPHPQSFKSEKELIKQYKSELSETDNVEWDELISPSVSMSRSDILISDTSSIRFDYAFLYEKPVITLNIDLEEMKGFERDHLKTIWSDYASAEIGFVIGKSSIDQLLDLIEKALSEFDQTRIRNLRKKTIHHFGKSGEVIAKYLADQIGTTNHDL